MINSKIRCIINCVTNLPVINNPSFLLVYQLRKYWPKFQRAQVHKMAFGHQVFLPVKFLFNAL